MAVPAGWSIKALRRLGSMGCCLGAPGRGNIPRKVSTAIEQIRRSWLTRKFCLFCSDIFITGRLQIPLSQTTLTIQNAHHISQIWRGLLFLRWWRCALFSIPTASLKYIAVSTSPSATPSIIEEVTFSPRWSFILLSPVVSLWSAIAPVTIPFSLFSAISCISVLPFSRTIVATG